MRKDYEQRLEDLAESKRLALREMNNMFEARLEEKDLMLQEVCTSTHLHLFFLLIYDLLSSRCLGTFNVSTE